MIILIIICLIAGVTTLPMLVVEIAGRLLSPLRLIGRPSSKYRKY